MKSIFEESRICSTFCTIVSFIEYFLFKTGLRYGELVALKWEDVDFKNGYIKHIVDLIQKCISL